MAAPPDRLPRTVSGALLCVNDRVRSGLRRRGTVGSNRRVVGAGLVGGFVAGGLAFGGSPVSAEPTAVDLSFGVNGTATVPVSPVFASGAGYGNGREVAATTDGRVYIAGRAGADFSYVGSAVTRFRSDGTLDTAFGDDGSVVLNLGDDTRVLDVDASADGGLLLLVSDIVPGQSEEFGLVRLLPSGSFDADYGTEGVFAFPWLSSWGSVGDMAVADDGTALVVGSGYGNGDDVVFKVTPAGESAAFGQYGWFQFPSEWARSKSLRHW